MVQIYPGTSQVAQNRRNFCDPEYELEKLREISDEDVVKILGHRAPGEEYKSVHPPLDEMDEPDDIVRELVKPIDFKDVNSLELMYRGILRNYNV